MLNLPKSVIDAYKSGEADIDIVISGIPGHMPLTNKDIVQGSVRLTESLCSQKTLKFGLVEAPSFEFSAFDIGDIRGQNITVTQRVFTYDRIDTAQLEEDAYIDLVNSSSGRFPIKRAQTNGSVDTEPYEKIKLSLKIKDLQVMDDAEFNCRLNGTLKKDVTKNIIFDSPHDYVDSCEFTGKNVSCRISGYQLYGGNWVEVPIGKYIVQSCKKQAGTNVRKVVAYGIDATSLVKSYNKIESALIKHKLLNKINTRSFVVSHLDARYLDFELGERIATPSAKNSDFKTLKFKYKDNINFFEETDIDIAVRYERIILLGSSNFAGKIGVFQSTGSTNGVYGAMEWRITDKGILNQAESILLEIKIGTKTYYEPICLAYGARLEWFDCNYLTDKNIKGIWYPIAFDYTPSGYGVTYNYETDEYYMFIYEVNVPHFDYTGNMVDFYINEEKADETRKIIESCLEIDGLFLKNDRDGFLKSFALSDESLYPSEDLYPSGVAVDIELSDYKLSSFWHDDYMVKPFGRIQAKYKDKNGEDAVAEYVFDETAENVYVIKDNPLLTDTNHAEADVLELLKNMSENIRGISYTPFDLTMRGLPYMEVGDSIIIHTKDEDIKTILLKRTLSGVRAMTDKISADGEELNTPL